MPITAETRLALTEFFLGCEDVVACAQYGLEWLEQHAGIGRALCAVSVSGDPHLSGVAGIGIDTPSIDHGPSQQFEAHRTSQPLNVYHIENAANLTSLPARGFTVVVAPVRIGGGSGAPARVFALVK